MGWKKWSSRDLRGSDIIDSRDVVERIEEIESEVEDAQNDLAEALLALSEALADQPDADRTALTARVDEARAALDTLKGDTDEELAALRALAKEGEAECSDWGDGATLVREGYFVEYAQNLADDIGAIDRNASWPLNHIDWDAAADELRGDYTELTFGGATYLARA
jgi:hypothetical protein